MIGKSILSWKTLSRMLAATQIRLQIRGWPFEFSMSLNVETCKVQSVKETSYETLRRSIDVLQVDTYNKIAVLQIGHVKRPQLYRLHSFYISLLPLDSPTKNTPPCVL